MKSETNQNPEFTSGSNVSYWTQSVKHDPLNPLNSDIIVDSVIVGGGLAGLTTAYCLVKSGRQVAILEDGQIGSGETGRTTAQLASALDDRYYNIEKTFGADKARLIAQSHAAAIDFVESAVRSERIDCGFERLNGYLFLHPSDKPVSLEREFEAASKATIGISWDDVPGMTSAVKGLRFANQAQFHPLKYLIGLKNYILDNGGQIFTGTKVTEVGNDGVTTESGFKVSAKNIVVATNVPMNSMLIFPTKQFAYRTYVIGALVPKGMLPKAMWWDTGDYEMDSDLAPYHYVRLQDYDGEHDLLISGGEDHPTGDTSDIDVSEEERYERLEKWTRKFFPVKEIVYKWSGQVMEPIDGVAYIGKSPLDSDNVYVITGDSGNGMTHCTIGGMLVSDLINGVKNPWEEVYSPWRFTFSESGLAFERLFGELISYFRQKPTTKKAQEFLEVKAGEARIVPMDNHKVGAYRSSDGELHIVSARCTHLGCFVAWNADEKTWDCPCHGSRFGYDGKVINGPANKDLAYYRDKSVMIGK